MSEAANPYAAPRQDTPALAPEPEAQLFVSHEFAGSAGRRVLAFLIDTAWTYLIPMFAMMPAMLIVLIAMGEEEGSKRLDRFANETFVLTVLGIFLSLTYFVLSEAIGGGTVGKLICGLRVVSNRTYRTPGIGAVLIRRLAIFIDTFFFGVPAWSSMEKSPYKERLGDGWADTYVLRTIGFPPGTATSTGRVLLGIFVGSSVSGTLAAVVLTWMGMK